MKLISLEFVVDSHLRRQEEVHLVLELTPGTRLVYIAGQLIKLKEAKCPHAILFMS